MGWYCRYAPSENTRRLVVEEGGFLYDSDAYNDDLPYWVKVGEKDHLVIPYTLDVNDMKFAVAPGFTSPSGYFEYMRDAFDVLYREGADAAEDDVGRAAHAPCGSTGSRSRARTLSRLRARTRRRVDLPPRRHRTPLDCEPQTVNVVEKLEALRVLGAYEGGIDRALLTPQERAARALFAKWARAGGIALTQDRVGNLFARRNGMRRIPRRS